jgi:hypothetical protein
MARQTRRDRPRERKGGERNERSSGGGGRCCWIPLLLFLVVLGVAFGVVFGVVPLDELKKFLGIDGSGTNSNGSNPESPTEAPVAFSFMQCPSTGDCCNGLESNCNLKPSEILWPTVHNAMHDGLLGNNKAPLEEALEAGYRGLMLDVCTCENELVFCHGVCTVGVRTFDEVIPNINKFLNQNPTEIILINFEISVNTPTPLQIWNEISKYNGMNNKVYIHNANKFPTMKELQDSSKRLLLFQHNGIDCTNTNTNGCTNRIPEFHKYTLETNWDFQNEAAIENYSQSCVGTRGTSSTQDFYLINHFVTTFLGASLSASKEINQRAALEERITECEKITKQTTNFLAVDFWQQGDLLEVAQEINKARGRRRRHRSLRSRIVDWIQ